MRLELINTGTELMLGYTINTHPAWIARRLASIGIRIARQTTVADDRAEMRQTLADALDRSDVVILTGGLGPTADDFTRDVTAELLGRTLVRDDSVAAAIADRFARRNISMPETVLVQALVPQGAHILANRNGTAPGLCLEHNGKLVILLPGPPRELQPMFDEFVIPLLQQRHPAATPLVCRVFKVAGMPESTVEERVAPAMTDCADVELGYCARMGEVEVRIVASTSSRADTAEKRIRAALGDNIFGVDTERLEDVVVRQLATAGRTIAVAESCTGGLIAHRITNVSGSSAVFLAGHCTYSNEAKVRDLGVNKLTLAQYGAVSEATAREMATGVRQRTGADTGIAVTGIAGPTGGTPDKPVGLVFIALATPQQTVVRRHVLTFDRETFKSYVSQLALDMVRRSLAGTLHP
jgi:nicotinamide-nucleotide amidase